MGGIHNAAAGLLPPHHGGMPLLHGKQRLLLLGWQAVQSGPPAGAAL